MFSTLHSSGLTGIFLKQSTTLRGLASKTNKLKRKKHNSILTRGMYRYWEPTYNRMELSQPHDAKKAPNQFRLVSYNILAQDLLVEHLQLYQGIHSKLLHWEHRLEKLKSELEILQPDILCLQEMQYNHLKSFVQELSHKRKVEYIFKKKTGRRTDGCAIIYDRNKFKLDDDQCVEYYTNDVATLNRENVAIMAKFQVRNDPSTEFIVATTHLLYNPRREDVRISQVGVLLRALASFAIRSKHSRLPTILAGDFNFTPDTDAYKCLVTQRKFNEYLFQMESIDFGSDAVSTFQDEWVTVDYILKSIAEDKEKSITIESTYKLPTAESCMNIGKIPNTFLGSDHFSLAISFSIR